MTQSIIVYSNPLVAAAWESALNSGFVFPVIVWILSTIIFICLFFDITKKVIPFKYQHKYVDNNAGLISILIGLACIGFTKYLLTLICL